MANEVHTFTYDIEVVISHPATIGADGHVSVDWDDPTTIYSGDACIWCDTCTEFVDAGTTHGNVTLNKNWMTV